MTTLETESSGIINFIDSVTHELSRSPEDLNIFEWVVEDRFLEEVQDVHEYFIAVPELLQTGESKIRLDLATLLLHLEDLEEYEKCQRVLEIQGRILPKLISKPHEKTGS